MLHQDGYSATGRSSFKWLAKGLLIGAVGLCAAGVGTYMSAPAQAEPTETLNLLGKSCPKGINPMKSLDAERYKGTWHEMYRVQGAVGQTGECGTVFYGDGPDDSISVRNVQLIGEKPNQTMKDIKGKVWCPNEKIEGACRLKFDSFFIPEGAYNVIDTDYENYAIVYTCATIARVFKQEQMWVMTRTPLTVGSSSWK